MTTLLDWPKSDEPSTMLLLADVRSSSWLPPKDPGAPRSALRPPLPDKSRLESKGLKLTLFKALAVEEGTAWGFAAICEESGLVQLFERAHGPEARPEL